MAYFETRGLWVGYHGKVLIRDIQIELPKGKIMTLIGPNGAGKTTVLRSITRNLSPIRGDAILNGRPISQWESKAFAKSAAVVLTDRVRPELMTCAEVVAMGRYPYTGLFGQLTPEDKRIVERSLKRVNALELAGQEFATLLDGQRQRILLARAVAQEPEVLVLDEPTAYLDIRYKVELLEILRAMSREDGTTIIMSLHEIDLAMKISDLLLCVKGETISAFGPPEKILGSHSIETLYDMDAGSYDPLFGSVELKKASGAPKVFVIAGGGAGIPVFRALQKQRIPFAAGILFENDLDYPVAKALGASVVAAPAFSPMTDGQLAAAERLMLSCDYYLDAGTPVGELNEKNGRLLQLARERGIPPWKEASQEL